MFNLNVSRMGRVGRIALIQRIRALFANSEPGLWYDPSDFSTLFQDSAGTTPVTAVDQPVGKILDKSGRGNHATQPTAINRPVIKQDAGGKYYLAFNGTNSWMSTGSINFSASDKMTVVAGVRKLSDTGGQLITELGSASAGGFYLYPGIFVSAEGAAYTSLSRGSATQTSAQAAVSPTTYAAPVTNVVAATHDISGDLTILRINAASVASATADQGTGNFGNYPLYIGAREGTSLFFNGNLYSLIVRGAASSDVQIASAETYANSKTGAY